jgi:peptide/nickel transport system substrate-binding protein
MIETTRRGLLKVTGGMAAAAGFAPGMAAAQNIRTVPRSRTLIVGAWAEAPTWPNVTMANYYAAGVNLENGLMYAAEPLFWYNVFRDEMIPWLAEGFSYNDNYTQLTLRIRRGAAWNDGVPFTARDVAFTYAMLIENGNGEKTMRKAVEVAQRVKQAVVVDDYTVRLDLARPDPRYIYLHPTSYYAYGLFWEPEHVWKAVPDKANFNFYDPAKGWPLTTSAWQVVRAAPNEVILDRRDDWWGVKTGFRPLPAPERIICVPAGFDRDRIAQMMVANDIDLSADIQDPNLLLEIMRRNPKVTSFSGNKPPVGNIDWWPLSLFFNNLDPQWSDVRVKRAIGFAMNAQQITEFSSGGMNEVNVTPYPAFPSLKPYLDAMKPIAAKYKVGVFDLAESARLMTEAGYAKDARGFWAKGGKTVGGAMHSFPLLNQVGPVVQQQLRRGGFDVTYFATQDSRRIMMNGECPLIVAGHNGSSIFDPLATLEWYHSKNQTPAGRPTFMFARFANKDYDAAVDHVAALPPGDKRIMEHVLAAMEIWYANMPEIPFQQWYHRVPMNTTYWTNWPNEANPYSPPGVNFESTPIWVAHNIKPVA